MPSVLSNDPPPDGSSAIRDALAQTLTQIVSFGIPYLLGRVYFSDRAALRDLAIGVVIAAAVYAPLCLFEARLSPQLHRLVYGYVQHDFGQTVRFGGYRPMVFLQHGLAVAMFMTSASVIATWMWWTAGRDASELGESGEPERGKGLNYLPLLLVPTTVMLKSSGALALGLVGAGVLVLGRATGSRWWIVFLAAVPVVYVSVRTTGEWSGESLVQFVQENIEADRAASLETRLMSENVLAQKALDRPAFGWGGWNRSMVVDEESGRKAAIPDGLWIIVLGNRGLVGLCALGCVLLLPVIRFAYLFPPTSWSNPAVAPAAACTVVLTLWSIDSLLNAMVLPIYFIIAGALLGFAPEDRGTAEP